jgi:CHAD domain-containing protein/adenylate cyclase class IV
MTSTSGPHRPIEIELKYQVVDPIAGDRYLVAEGLAGFRPTSPVRATQVEDRYIDTPDGALARAGFAARLRQTAKGTTVGVKSAVRRVDGSVHRREELEGPADRTAPPRDWPASDARSLILEQCGDAPLVEVVTIRQLRRKRILERAGTAVEFSLDEVDAVTRSRVVGRFVELEVELIRGDEAGLTEIDHALALDPGLAPADSSKLQRALLAVAATEPKRQRRSSTVLPPVDVDDPDGEPPESAVDVDRIVSAALGTPSAEPASGPSRAAVGGAASAPEPATAPVTSGGGAPVDQTPSSPASPEPAKTVAAAEPDAAGASGQPPRRKRDIEREPDERPKLVVGKTPGVLADDHLAEAGRKVLRFHLARMIAREPGTRDGRDPEDLHAMRVATRRQRAAWRIFGEAFRSGRTKAHRSRLRDVAARLGAVRDLDVLLEGADAYRADLPVAEQRALEPLLATWRTHRDDARLLLVRELDSDGYRRWLDDYAEFVRHEGVAARPFLPTEPHRVRDTAGSRIQAAYEQVRAYEPVLRWADVETLHELRIAGKWLRYSLEFVRETLGPDGEALIARVTALQDHLGLLHDADVAAHLARDFLLDQAGSLSDAESAAIGRYLVNREREVGRLRRSVGAGWRGVAGLSFRRGLGRALAQL